MTLKARPFIDSGLGVAGRSLGGGGSGWKVSGVPSGLHCVETWASVHYSPAPYHEGVPCPGLWLINAFIHVYLLIWVHFVESPGAKEMVFYSAQSL